MTGWQMGTDAWVWIGAWVLVMAVVVWRLVREPRRTRHQDPAGILRARFARGEISEEEYRRAVAALDEDPPLHHASARRRAARRQEAHHD